MTKVKDLESLPFIAYYNLASIAEIQDVPISFFASNHFLHLKKQQIVPKAELM